VASKILNHVYIPGARSYQGIRISPLDRPAETLKAGVDVPGGENMPPCPMDKVALRPFTGTGKQQDANFPGLAPARLGSRCVRQQ